MFLPWLYDVPEPAFETGYWLADGWTAVESAQLANRWNATFLLPWYVSEELGRTDLLVEWARWVGSDLNPMGSLDDLLAGEGEDLGAVMIDLWAGVQSRRFEDPEHQTWIEDFWTYWGKPASLHHNPTAVLEVGADAVSPPEAWRPERFGANVLRVEAPEDDLLFTLEPDAAGSEGTPVRWGAAAVVCTGDVCEDEVLAVDAFGSTTLPVAAAGADLADLVLVPITGDYTEGETFGYRVSARLNAEEPGGCGCGASRRPARAVLPLALLLLCARRRRERSPTI